MVCATPNLEKVIGTDTQYSIHALTDESGAITEGYQYDAYGRQTVFTANGADTTWFTNDDTQAMSVVSAVGNPYGYTGRRFDNETEIIHMRYRQYDPDTGRFIGQDPYGYADGLNLYTNYFVINSADPLGLVEYNFTPESADGMNYTTEPLGNEELSWSFNDKLEVVVDGGVGATTRNLKYNIECKVIKDSDDPECCEVKCSITYTAQIVINEAFNGDLLAMSSVYGHEQNHIIGTQDALRRLGEAHLAPLEGVIKCEDYDEEAVERAKKKVIGGRLVYGALQANHNQSFMAIYSIQENYGVKDLKLPPKENTGYPPQGEKMMPIKPCAKCKK